MDSNRLPPRIVTWNDLLKTLLPYVTGYAWAMGALHDLWEMGAPSPDSTSANEKRLLLPNQFGTWWADVRGRMGHSQSAPDMWRRIRNS